MPSEPPTSSTDQPKGASLSSEEIPSYSRRSRCEAFSPPSIIPSDQPSLNAESGGDEASMGEDEINLNIVTSEGRVNRIRFQLFQTPRGPSGIAFNDTTNRNLGSFEVFKRTVFNDIGALTTESPPNPNSDRMFKLRLNGQARTLSDEVVPNSYSKTSASNSLENLSTTILGQDFKKRDTLGGGYSRSEKSRPESAPTWGNLKQSHSQEF